MPEHMLKANKSSNPGLSHLKAHPLNTHNKSLKTQGAGTGTPLFLQKSSDTSAHSSASSSAAGLGAAINRSRSGGATLPRQTQKNFDASFGTDLSSVRVHDGSQHNELAHGLRAKAFTVGSDIFFAQGQYRPGSQHGDRLLAHELTHVMQQSSGQVQAKALDSGIQMGESGDHHEQEAERVADRVVSGQQADLAFPSAGIYSSIGLSSATNSIIQRDDDEDEQGFDYSVLPPSLAYRAGAFGLSADTSAAQLSYFNDEDRLNLGYQYGGDIFYGANMDGFNTRFGLNPQTGIGSMSLGGSHEGFRYGLSGNTAGSFGLNLGYGAALLPMPLALGQQAGAAWSGATGVGGAIPDFVSDPMATYAAQRDNIAALSTFGGSMGQIYGQQGSGALPFGAGLSLSYNPEQRWVFGAGVQGSF
jgi:hypothetical protein